MAPPCYAVFIARLSFPASTDLADEYARPNARIRTIAELPAGGNERRFQRKIIPSTCPAAFGLLGLLGIIGLIVLACLPDKLKE